MTDEDTGLDSTPKPATRRLQIYTLDPSSETRVELALISRSVLPVGWEPLEPGPIGEYIEVIDVDPSTGVLYGPIDLDAYLATDGLTPSVGDPQFHQQMVYAIAMATISTFEHVLGRPILWAERRRDASGEYHRAVEDRYVGRLRLYPHALRSSNAYYSPAKKAILFGYFNAISGEPGKTMPGELTFTCLSHDIIVHEITHAILDGLMPKLLRVSNPDMLAFHEAFADLVAIFEHFALPELLNKEIATTRGDLGRNNLLARLAEQFARSTGRGDALRNALGRFDRHGVRQRPDPEALRQTREPHARGAILVAAVFDAFLLVYQGRVADLRRIATGGTGVLPEGDIHPDLTARFAYEAVKVARRMLKICIRAVDYLPPVDVTFGDFLRAAITADRGVVAGDTHRYRTALVESFREKGIYPHDVRSLSEESLRWRTVAELDASRAERETLAAVLPPRRVLRSLAQVTSLSATVFNNLQSGAGTDVYARRDKGAAREAARLLLEQLWVIDPLEEETSDDTPRRAPGRREEFVTEKAFATFLHRWITARLAGADDASRRAMADALGIDREGTRDAPKGEAGAERVAPFEVLGVRRMLHPRPDGVARLRLRITIAQRRLVPLHDDGGEALVSGVDGTPLTFHFRSGVTLIVDPERGSVEYAIRKSAVVDGDTRTGRAARQAAFLCEELAASGEDAIERYALTEATDARRHRREAFAFVHAAQSEEGTYA